MNKYILLRRLTGPCILLLLGVVALLHQADLVSWGIFFPLLLILLGVLKLAQRAALAAAGDEPIYPGTFPDGGYPGGPYSYGASSAPSAAAQAPAEPGTSIVPSPPQDFGSGSKGGQQ
jgi:hypothetical protein